MEQVHVREGNGEVLIFIDKHLPSPFEALKEASKIIQREVLRYEARANNSPSWPVNRNGL